MDPQALRELMAMPDEPAMPLRAHTLKQAGDPTRFDLLRLQPNIYAAWVSQAREDGSGHRPRLS